MEGKRGERGVEERLSGRKRGIEREREARRDRMGERGSSEGLSHPMTRGRRAMTHHDLPTSYAKLDR